MELTLENWRMLLEDAHEFKEAEYAVRLVDKLLTLQRQATIAEKEREFAEKGMDFFYYKLDQAFKSFNVSVTLGKVLQEAKRKYSHSKKDEVDV